jgi:hypothetical protein
MPETDDKTPSPDQPEVDAPATVLDEPRDTVLVAAPVKPSEASRRSGMFGTLLGGVLAAGTGFGLAQYVPGGWPFAETTALIAGADAQAKDLGALRDEVGRLSAALSGLDAQSAGLTELASQVSGLETKIAGLEAAQVGSGKGVTLDTEKTIRALQADVAALQSAKGVSAGSVAATQEAEAQLEAAKAEAAQITAAAEALAKASAARAALGQLRTALDTGADYSTILAELGGEPPVALVKFATTGLPTMAQLQESFPASARLALESALRADMGESWTERLGSFLRSQTGARSLAPREGNDPDAVLSRAEAALVSGDLTQTLLELSNLPQVGQAAMAEWQATAQIRIDAERAVAEIAAQMSK